MLHVFKGVTGYLSNCSAVCTYFCFTQSSQNKRHVSLTLLLPHLGTLVPSSKKFSLAGPKALPRPTWSAHETSSWQVWTVVDRLTKVRGRRCARWLRLLPFSAFSAALWLTNLRSCLIFWFPHELSP